MNCTFCNNTFLNNKSLLKHQRTAKYCILKHQKHHTCGGCSVFFLSSNDLVCHEYICVNILTKKNKELEEENKMSEDNVQYFQNEMNTLKQINKILEEQNKSLKDELKSSNDQIKSLQEQIISITKTAVMRSTTTNNTTINNKILNMTTFNFNDNDIKNLIDDKYSIEVISEGQKGVARFAVNYILRDDKGNLNYLCTDSSRKIFKFKNEIGELEKDINAQKLTNLLTDNGILKATTKLAQNYWTNEDGTIDDEKLSNMISKASEIHFMKDDNTVFKNELATMTSI